VAGAPTVTDDRPPGLLRIDLNLIEDGILLRVRTYRRIGG
jgi:hypothetical protein